MSEPRVWTYASVGVFSTIGIVCATMVIARLPYWGDKSPEWVGALGTIAAFAGTIWIATAETRRRHRDEMTRARLQAAALAFRIRHVILETNELTSKIDKFYDVNDTDKCLSYCAHVKETMEAMNLWTIDEVAILAPLPDNTAARLAQASDEIYRLITLMQAAARNGLVSLEPRKMTERSMRKVFNRINKLLRTAAKECDSARFMQD